LICLLDNFIFLYFNSISICIFSTFWALEYFHQVDGNVLKICSPTWALFSHWTRSWGRSQKRVPINAHQLHIRAAISMVYSRVYEYIDCPSVGLRTLYYANSRGYSNVKSKATAISFGLGLSAGFANVCLRLTAYTLKTSPPPILPFQWPRRLLYYLANI